MAGLLARGSMPPAPAFPGASCAQWLLLRGGNSPHTVAGAATASKGAPFLPCSLFTTARIAKEPDSGTIHTAKA